MAGKFRSFTKRLLIVLNILVVVVFLLSCLSPYLDPGKWWFISLLSLAYPFLLFFTLVSFFFWLFVKPKYSLGLLLVLMVGWNNTSNLFAFHSPKKFNYEKEEGSLRVVTWNVARFVEIFKNNNKGSQTRLKMMDLLRQQDADILCLQEFHTSEREDFYDNISYIQKNLDYPYYHFSFDEDGNKLYYSSIIFSRFPIVGKSVEFYPRPTIPEALLKADIKLGDDTVTIFTTHLQSVQFARSDYKKINEIKNYEDSIMANSKTIFSKLKRGVSYRAVQANMMRQRLDAATHPLIVCGDFNDVPNSYTYNKVRGDLNDVFLEKGFGIGRTFSSLSPTLRIDYILTDKRFDILQINRPVKNYSDHYMLVADLKLKNRN